MSKKIEFIKYVETLIEATKNNPVEMNEDAHFYWESFRKTEEIEKPTFTENGKKLFCGCGNIQKCQWLKLVKWPKDW